MTTQTVVIGGGISGLSAAWYLQQQGIQYAVLEAGSQWGGKVFTDRPSLNDAPFIFDAGAESFITRKPEVWQLAHELGLQDDLVAPINEARGIGILHSGRIYPMPLNPIAFITSGLLSPMGKLRMLAEPFIRPRHDMGDETLADFAQRRLGKEVMERLIGPILGGIYNADPQYQSVMVSATHMRQLEAKYGGLFRGMLAMMRQRKRATTPLPPRFITFKHGAGSLVNKLVEQLTGELHLQATVREVCQSAQGYDIHLTDGRFFHAPSIIFATPANITAELIQPFAPHITEKLHAIPHNSIGTVFMVFRDEDMPQTSKITGLMIPRREQRRLDAVLWTSHRVPDRAPSGYTVLKIFFGGARPEMMNETDEALIAHLQDELRALFNITSPPVLHRIYRWQNSYPLAEVGHLDRIDEIETGLPSGIFLAGSSYRGIGVPDCIRQGKQASHVVTQFIGNVVLQGKNSQ